MGGNEKGRGVEEDKSIGKTEIPNDRFGPAKDLKLVFWRSCRNSKTKRKTVGAGRGRGYCSISSIHTAKVWGCFGGCGLYKKVTKKRCGAIKGLAGVKEGKLSVKGGGTFGRLRGMDSIGHRVKKRQEEVRKDERKKKNRQYQGTHAISSKGGDVSLRNLGRTSRNKKVLKRRGQEGVGRKEKSDQRKNEVIGRG